MLRPSFLFPLALFSLTAAVAGCPQPRPVGPPIDENPAPDSGVLVCADDAVCGNGVCVGGICEGGKDPVIDGECQSKSQCEEGAICKEGACVAPPERCRNSEECPGTRICDGFTGQCVDPFGGCSNDASCTAEPQCAGTGCRCTDGDCLPISVTPGNDAGTPDAGGNQGGNDGGFIPSGDSVDLGGFVIENHESEPVRQSVVLPPGTVLRAGQVLVIGRDATINNFQAAWGVTFGPNVVYLTTRAGSSGVPIINGSEKWALLSATGTLIDGITISGSSGKSYQRTASNGRSNPDSSGSWVVSTDGDATPGSVSLPASGQGLVISEWSDLSGEGNYAYEFIEIYYAP